MADRLLKVARRALLLGAAEALLGVRARAAPGALTRLFILTRSKNANEVHYNAQLTPKGQLDATEPIVAHWVMLAEDGRRESLTALERRLAYGWTTQLEPQGNALRLRMQAFSQREIRVARDDKGVFRPTLTIARQPATLEKIFVATVEHGPKPSVQYVDLLGLTLSQNKPVRERIKA